MRVTEDIKEHIRQYHHLGYNYRLIHHLLETRHECTISYLQRKLIPSLGLRRRGQLDDNVVNIINQATSEISNGVAGSEQLRRTLELSRELVRIIDPEGVERRKRHRLRRRQYISRVMWLKAGITNKRPEVIASYFIEAVNQEGGFPLRVPGDRGTENGAVAAVQRALRDSERAFLYGRSTSNQRIERWWGYLRNARADYWMNEIKLLERDNRLERADPIQRLCLQYALLPFIGRQLDEIKHLWNTHSIRNQRVGDTLPGIPDILHTQVELYDGEFLEIVEQ
ncbi:hypothetical protein MAR_010722, partial [Mya arenaria]